MFSVLKKFCAYQVLIMWYVVPTAACLPMIISSLQRHHIWFMGLPMGQEIWQQGSFGSINMIILLSLPNSQIPSPELLVAASRLGWGPSSDPFLPEGPSYSSFSHDGTRLGLGHTPSPPLAVLDYTPFLPLGPD